MSKLRILAALFALLLSACAAEPASESETAEPTETSEGALSAESRLRTILATPRTIRFSCDYRIYVPPTGYYGSYGRYETKGGSGTLLATLRGDQLVITRNTVSDPRGAGWWAPGTWTFSLANMDSASVNQLGAEYGVATYGSSLLLTYSRAPRNGEWSQCRGAL
jgi:hypothetical protein